MTDYCPTCQSELKFAICTECNPPAGPTMSDAMNINGQRYVLREDYDALTTSLLTERGKLEKSDAENDRLATMCGEQFTRISTLSTALDAALAERDKAYGEVDVMKRERVRIRLVLGLTPYDEGPSGLPESVIALRKDAARYRWLRDEAEHEQLDMVIIESDAEWDALIDQLSGADGDTASGSE